MKIFVAYASERYREAVPIAHALKEDGDDVFFDREDLPAGWTYNNSIRKAIEESPVYDFGRVRVNSVYLFESELKPTGAVYRSLFEARLGDFFE